MNRREFLAEAEAAAGLAATSRAWPQSRDQAKLARLAIMSLSFGNILKNANQPDEPARTLDLMDIGQMYADRFGIHHVELQHTHIPSTEEVWLKEFRARLAQTKCRVTNINLEFGALTVSATVLMAGSTGHLGPTIYRSTDRGKSWNEATAPPAFRKAPEGEQGRSVGHVFWLTPCHANEPNVWYAGTSPQGLFRSEDGGATWKPFSSINNDPRYLKWMGTVQDGTPDGPKLHSIIVDPPAPRHLYFAMSGGGVHESTDGGETWAPLLKGLEVVEGFDAAEPTFHDPHCIRLCPANPDLGLYQQNHCGIYRLDRPSDEWLHIGRGIPERVGDIGFPMVVHPRDPDIAWVFPMDGTTVWPRTSPEGKPAVYATRDAGANWQRLDGGLPPGQAWWTVKRQAMSADAADPVVLSFGTTSGELWASRDEGGRWTCIARHLPEIYAVEAAHPA